MSNESKPRSGSNVALIVSLCLNFLLAGLIVMALVRFSMIHPLFAPATPGDFPRGGGMGHGMWQMQPLSPQAMMNVAPGKAGQIRSIIEAHRPRIHELRMSSFDARNEALRLLAAPAFDKSAYDKSLAKLQNADAALEAEVLKAVSECAAVLSPEERRAAAAAPPDWGHGHGYGHGHGHGWRHGGGRQMQDTP
jgi:uncharacterized membrane protein